MALFTQCLVMMTKMPHNQTQVQLLIPKRGGPEESDEKEEDGTGEGGLSTDLGEVGRVRQKPLPKHLGQVTSFLWGCSSKQGPIHRPQVWMDSM